jgi:hypothetical protein
MKPLEAYQKEEAEIQARFQRGEITNEQMRNEVCDLWIGFRKAEDKAAGDEWERERNNW